jgi:PAS domain-containing protein
MVDNKKTKSGAGGKIELALHYMKTLADVAREAFLILSPDLKVISANQIFYQSFQVSPKETEGKFIYKLGNGQWNIPGLKNLLEKILPEKKIVTNYEVTHTFETIGEKTMLLNAKQIDSIQLIILAIEDITPRKKLENKLTENAKNLEIEVAQRTVELNERVETLEALNKTMVGRECKMVALKKEITDLKKLTKNGNGNHNGNHNDKNEK